ncbi:DUF2252 family protein [Sphingomonas abietis]|uniref:DUF2252 family protein n=1 Tax=Sphingomonas abietis TaxID=3012344 RepID=A0ABY7NUE3_9SPHN|nr:DUF2252 family protein [Sphingomonas abietis]WBO24061.1 DUF2252 family protein [Sphingomonas abietis]
MAPPQRPIEFLPSMARREAGMRTALGPLIVESDLLSKHKRMRKDAFLFLRGTCWRWAETAAHECNDLTHGPAVASIGDAHVGNFGLWRDAEGRLIWGVNDYDEAAILPYRMDITRLVASAMMARGDKDMAGELSEAALDGYAAGLADPRPYVLEQDHIWLRDIFVATDDERIDFWAKLRGAAAGDDIPAAFREALIPALPAGAGEGRFARRRAGVGSLGLPRIVLLADDAGGPIAREAKALLPSCWSPDTVAGAHLALSSGPYRCPDPFLHLAGGIVVRRLGPNSRKIDLDANKRRVRRRLIEAMARDIGAIHAQDATTATAIRQHLQDEGHGWLPRAVQAMTKATLRDWHAFRDGTDRHGRPLPQ